MFLLILYMAFIGLAAWLAIKYIPMVEGVKTVIIVFAVVACVLLGLHAMGIGIPNPGVPQIR